MKRIVDIPVEELVPSTAAVLRAMGVPEGPEPGPRTIELVERAIREFRETADARGVLREVGADDFARVYAGEGGNDTPAPLERIYPMAEALVLFAATVGARVSERIPALFDEGEVALGAALDAAASEGTELAGAHLDGVVLRESRADGRAGEGARALSYSPGYCGWNVTGQRALFERLEPGEIGISLNDSCLMQPLKSISGVTVVGPAKIHEFEDEFDFCSYCATHDCRQRIKGLENPGRA